MEGGRKKPKIGYYCQIREDGFLAIRGSDPFWLRLGDGVWWWKKFQKKVIK